MTWLDKQTWGYIFLISSPFLNKPYMYSVLDVVLYRWKKLLTFVSRFSIAIRMILQGNTHTQARTVISNRTFISMGSNSLTYFTLRTQKLTGCGLTRWLRYPPSGQSALPAHPVCPPPTGHPCEGGQCSSMLKHIFQNSEWSFTQFGSCICKKQFFISILKLLFQT